MRAWLYYRLSRDEDEEMNSLQNQRQILVDYAEQNGYEIVGESFDDNVSGMTFNRKGLGELEIAVDEGKIDVVLVKDLSRLGRHRTQTELFIDHLRQNNVKVYSVTEGIDSSNENDDLMIGFKQIFNDFYAKDISKKVNLLDSYERYYICTTVVNSLEQINGSLWLLAWEIRTMRFRDLLFAIDPIGWYNIINMKYIVDYAVREWNYQLHNY